MLETSKNHPFLEVFVVHCFKMEVHTNDSISTKDFSLLAFEVDGLLIFYADNVFRNRVVFKDIPCLALFQ